MTHIAIQPPTRNARTGYKVNSNRGERIGRVSSEWFSSPADERYLSLYDLHDWVKTRSEHSRTRIVASEAIRVEATRENAERLTLTIPGSYKPVTPTHWSFGQLARRRRGLEFNMISAGWAPPAGNYVVIPD